MMVPVVEAVSEVRVISGVPVLDVAVVPTVHDGTTRRLPTCSLTQCPANCRIGCREPSQPFPAEPVPAFERYVGIDYSGARTPTASLKGLRVYLAEDDAVPVEFPSPPSPRKFWTRRGIAEWLVDRLAWNSQAAHVMPASQPHGLPVHPSRTGVTGVQAGKSRDMVPTPGPMVRCTRPTRCCIGLGPYLRGQLETL